MPQGTGLGARAGQRPGTLAVMFALTAMLLPTGAAAGEGTWSARDIAEHGLSDVAFVGERGWAVGDTGTLLASTDGGVTWSPQDTGTGVDLRGVDAVGERGWAVGSGGTLVRTGDGGQTWTRGSTGTGTDLHAVEFVDGEHGWAAGVRPFPQLASTIIATTDGGETWSTQLELPGFTVGSLSFADRRHGFAGAQLGAAYRTDDGGQTWLPMALPAGAVATVDAVLRVDEDLGFLAAGATVYRTTTGGAAWLPVLEADERVHGIAAAGAVVFAVGGTGLAARSADGGTTWEVAAAGTAGSLRAVEALPDGSAVAVGRRSHPGAPDSGVAAVYTTADLPPLDIGLHPQHCDGPVDIGWTHAAAGYKVSAASGDLTGDGRDEIVVSGSEGVRALVPFHPTAEAALWEVPFQAPLQQVFVADVTGDGALEVVAVSSGTGSRAGVAVLDGATGQLRWSRRISGGVAFAAVGDVTGDGAHEVVVASGGRTLHVLQGGAGSPLGAALPLGEQVWEVALGDLTGDGRLEAAVALEDGRAVAVHLADGPRELWTHEVASGTLRGVAIGDVTGDGAREVVVAGRGLSRSVTPGRGDDSGTSIGTLTGYLVAALEGDTGALVWDYGQARGGTAAFNAVEVADLDGDGGLDVVAHGSRLGSAHLLALAGPGRELAGGLSTGEPLPLWRLDATRGEEDIQATYRALGLVTGDVTGEGAEDVFVASWNGSVLAVAGVPDDPDTLDPVVEPPTGTLRWEAARRPPAAHVSTYAGPKGPLVVTTFADHHVALRDPATGEVVWQYDAGGSPSVTAGEFGGLFGVGVATTAGRVYGLDAAGALLRPDRDVFLPLGAVGVVAVDVTGDGADDLVAAARDGTVLAMSPTAGEALWETTVDAPATAIVTDGAQVVVGTAGGRLVALEAGSGALAWERTPGAAVTGLAYAPAAERFAVGDAAGTLMLLTRSGDVHADTHVDDGAITRLAAADMTGDGVEELAFVRGSSYRSYDLDGRERWRVDTAGLGVELAVGDLTGDGLADVIAAGLDGQAHAFAALDGTRLWSLDNGLPGPLAIAVLSGDGVAEALVTQKGGPDRLRTVDAAGTVTGTCTLRKEPHAMVVAGRSDGEPAKAVMTTRQGDVYLFGDPPVEPLTRPGAPVDQRNASSRPEATRGRYVRPAIGHALGTRCRGT